jgi:hypothetical protein
MPALDWIGKQAALHHHAEVPFRLFRYDESPSARVRRADTSSVPIGS